jgi:hypothetical protein
MAKESEQGFVQRRSGDCLRLEGDCIAPPPLAGAVQRGCSRIPGGQQNFPTLGLGGFGEGWLWSSSQNNNNNAWKQKFSDGNQNNNNKNNKYSVRAVRALELGRLWYRSDMVDAGGPLFP